MSEVIVITSGKGGVGKTTTVANIGTGLAMLGKKVVVVDTDIGLRNLDVVLGLENRIVYNLVDVINGSCRLRQALIKDKRHPELCLLPSAQTKDKSAVSPEQMIKLTDDLREQFDYILLDCMPSLGMLTVNALAAADNVLIPVQAAYLPAKGLEQLLGTINKVKRQINPKLRIEGILLTMVDSRTNYSKDISNLIRESYGGKLKVYKTDIPRSVRAEEISAEGTSIFKHDPKGKVAEAYKILTKEVLNNAEKRRKHQLEGVR